MILERSGLPPSCVWDLTIPVRTLPDPNNLAVLESNLRTCSGAGLSGPAKFSCAPSECVFRPGAGGADSAIDTELPVRREEKEVWRFDA
jgi:hypothetical protein